MKRPTARTRSPAGVPFEKENVGEEVVIAVGKGSIPEESDEDEE
jgi:hypothetical protein